MGRSEAIDSSDSMVRPSWLDGFKRITTGGRFLPEIDGLRFIAILAVFLHHDLNHIMAKNNIAKIPGTKQVDHDLLSGFDWLFSAVIDRGSFGVQLFFVISGFILALPFANHFLKQGRKPSLKAYFVRRLTRLEPPYILALVLWLPFAFYYMSQTGGGSPHTVGYSFLASVFYVHNQAFHEHSFVNGVSWTLEIEVQFYILAPLLSYIFLFRVTWLRRLILGSFILFMSVYNALTPPVSPAYVLSILYFVQYFLSGFLLADIYLTRLQSHPQKAYKWDFVALFVAIAVTLSLICIKRSWPSPGLVLALAKIAPSVLTPLFCFCAFKGKALNRILCLKPVWIIGGMCYSIYLVHLPLLSILAYLSKPLYFQAAPLWVNFLFQAAFHGVIVLVLSAAFFKLIERPCMDKDWPQKLLAFFRRKRTVADRSQFGIKAE